MIKNSGLGPYNSLYHGDNRKYFSGLPLAQNQREACMFHLGREVGKIWKDTCYKKGNYILISGFKYGQTF